MAIPNRMVNNKVLPSATTSVPCSAGILQTTKATLTVGVNILKYIRYGAVYGNCMNALIK